MYKNFLRPLLFQLNPETAHHITAGAGQTLCSLPAVGSLVSSLYATRYPELEHYLMGLRFTSPLGMAAGFDKNATLTQLLKSLGFGYAEYGSVTARPSPGNPKPRLFRLPHDMALINRMGLNNEGAGVICQRIAENRRNNPTLYHNFPCGINIAKTHDPSIMGDRAIEDYLTSYRLACTAADYLTLNISCPNTAEGKTFEEPSALEELLSALSAIRTKSDPPLFVKLSPDTTMSILDRIIDICESFGSSGYVFGNTTRSRDGLVAGTDKSPMRETGGLSGAPLYEKTRKRIRYLRSNLPASRILIACGGIDTPDKAIRMFATGADSLQLYTGLVYKGPALIKQINRKLAITIRKEGYTSFSEWLIDQKESEPA